MELRADATGTLGKHVGVVGLASSQATPFFEKKTERAWG